MREYVEEKNLTNQVHDLNLTNWGKLEEKNEIIRKENKNRTQVNLDQVKELYLAMLGFCNDVQKIFNEDPNYVTDAILVKLLDTFSGNEIIEDPEEFAKHYAELDKTQSMFDQHHVKESLSSITESVFWIKKSINGHMRSHATEVPLQETDSRETIVMKNNRFYRLTQGSTFGETKKAPISKNEVLALLEAGQVKVVDENGEEI